MALENGIHQIPWDLYNSIDRVRWSKLKNMKKSPAHYEYSLLEKEEDTDAKKTGRAAHMATFEPEAFRSKYVVWDQGRRGSNKWDAFEKKHQAEGHEILTENEHAKVLAVSQAVRTNEMSAPYLKGGQREVSVLWTVERSGVEGLPALKIDCKSRLDFVSTARAIVDLKTARCAGPDEFGAACARYGYAEQAAFYQDAYWYVTGERLPYVIVAVEPEPPYVVQVYPVPEDVIQFGRDRYIELLYKLAECRRTGVWPGYATGPMDLRLPHWAMPQEDVQDDPTGMGLIFGDKEAA